MFQANNRKFSAAPHKEKWRAASTTQKNKKFSAANQRAQKLWLHVLHKKQKILNSHT
jgi:hypothetical protein